MKKVAVLLTALFLSGVVYAQQPGDDLGAVDPIPGGNGQSNDIPVPGALALILAGLGAGYLVSRRRK